MIDCCVLGCPDNGSETLQLDFNRDQRKLKIDVPICKMHARLCQAQGVEAIMSEPLTTATVTKMYDAIEVIKDEA